MANKNTVKKGTCGTPPELCALPSTKCLITVRLKWREGPLQVFVHDLPIQLVFPVSVGERPLHVDFDVAVVDDVPDDGDLHLKGLRLKGAKYA